MKWELIDKIFEYFNKDQKVIKKNLMLAVDRVILESKDKYGKVRMIIEYERSDSNGTNDNKES